MSVLLGGYVGAELPRMLFSGASLTLLLLPLLPVLLGFASRHGDPAADSSDRGSHP